LNRLLQKLSRYDLCPSKCAKQLETELIGYKRTIPNKKQILKVIEEERPSAGKFNFQEHLLGGVGSLSQLLPFLPTNPSSARSTQPANPSQKKPSQQPKPLTQSSSVPSAVQNGEQERCVLNKASLPSANKWEHMATYDPATSPPNPLLKSPPSKLKSAAVLTSTSSAS
jgi:hypothetical protein